MAYTYGVVTRLIWALERLSGSISVMLQRIRVTSQLKDIAGQGEPDGIR
jgi:hypothetical protein